jgi:sugar phosphate isomerase/epimerase
MPMNRRTMLAACAAAAPALHRGPLRAGAGSDRSSALGVVIHSFPVQLAADRARKAKPPFDDPIRFLDYCRRLGVHSVQVGIGARPDRYADALRRRAEEAGIHLEGIVALPRDEADLDRLEAELRTAKRAGATIVRTVCLSGRRYETFKSAAAFVEFGARSLHSLNLAAGAVARQGVFLAVENHKDWRADELLVLLGKVGSDRLGVCLDTGNSISLLEDPMEFVEALAPRALTTHFKDMAMEEYRDGFLLAEVPLGTGVLDLPRVVRVLREARPEIRFNLEMITRDPLEVPCLTDRYWETFGALPGRHLARTLSLVRAHPPKIPLVRISRLDPEGRIKAEDVNVQNCLVFARERLGI